MFGLVNLSYPVWWPLFRNHPAGTRLGPVWALTPFGIIGTRTFAGTFLTDGAQIRLATLAMNLGMATEKLGADGPPPDLAQARELVALAHRGAKDALADLRDLVRGIHPPVLDYSTRLLADRLDGVGYLLKDRVADVADFVDALTRVASGGTALDPEVVGHLIRAGRLALPGTGPGWRR